MNVSELLKSVDFTEREAKVYLGLLSLGRGTVQEIAAKSGVKRVTTHAILNDLIKRELVHFIKHGKKTFVIPESPEKLSAIFESRREELVHKEKELRKALPHLLHIHSLAQAMPTIQFYEGVDGIALMREQLFKMKGKEMVSFISLDYVDRVFPKHEAEHAKRRAELGIKSRVIYTLKSGPRVGYSNEKSLREAKFVPPDRFPFESNIYVFDDKLALISLKGELNGVLIKSESIAQTMRSVFELAWLAALKL